MCPKIFSVTGSRAFLTLSVGGNYFEKPSQSIIYLFQQECNLTEIREIQLLSFLLAISDFLKMETINNCKIGHIHTCKFFFCSHVLRGFKTVTYKLSYLTLPSRPPPQKKICSFIVWVLVSFLSNLFSLSFLNGLRTDC